MKYFTAIKLNGDLGKTSRKSWTDINWAESLKSKPGTFCFALFIFFMFFSFFYVEQHLHVPLIVVCDNTLIKRRAKKFRLGSHFEIRLTAPLDSPSSRPCVEVLHTWSEYSQFRIRGRHFLLSYFIQDLTVVLIQQQPCLEFLLSCKAQLASWSMRGILIVGQLGQSRLTIQSYAAGYSLSEAMCCVCLISTWNIENK